MSDNFIADFKATIEASWATIPQEGTTTPAQAKQELKVLDKDLVAITEALKVSPINLTRGEIEKIKPEIIAYCTSHLRVAYTLKNVSSPFSPLEHLEIHALIHKIHADFLECMLQCRLRLTQTEADLPGYAKFFVYVLQKITKPYHHHLAKAVPSTIPEIVVVEFGTAADAAVLGAVDGLPL